MLLILKVSLKSIGGEKLARIYTYRCKRSNFNVIMYKQRLGFFFVDSPMLVTTEHQAQVNLSQHTPCELIT